MVSEVNSNKVFKITISDDEAGKEQQDMFLNDVLFNNRVILDDT